MLPRRNTLRNQAYNLTSPKLTPELNHEDYLLTIEFTNHDLVIQCTTFTLDRLPIFRTSGKYENILAKKQT